MKNCIQHDIKTSYISIIRMNDSNLLLLFARCTRALSLFLCVNVVWLFPALSSAVCVYSFCLFVSFRLHGFHLIYDFKNS